VNFPAIDTLCLKIKDDILNCSHLTGSCMLRMSMNSNKSQISGRNQFQHSHNLLILRYCALALLSNLLIFMDYFQDFGYKLSIGEYADDEFAVPESEEHTCWRVAFTDRCNAVLESQSTHLETKLAHIREIAVGAERVELTANRIWAKSCELDDFDTAKTGDIERRVVMLATVLSVYEQEIEAAESHSNEELVQLQNAKAVFDTGSASAKVLGFHGFVNLVKEEPWKCLLGTMKSHVSELVELSMHDKSVKDGVIQCGSKQIALVEEDTSGMDEVKPHTHTHTLPTVCLQLSHVSLLCKQVKRLLETVRAEICLLQSGRLSATTKLLLGRLRTKESQSPCLQFQEFCDAILETPWCHFLPLHQNLITPELDVLHSKYVLDFNQRAGIYCLPSFCLVLFCRVVLSF